MELGEVQKWEMIGNGNGVSFRDDENALKLDDGYGCPFVLWKDGKIPLYPFKFIEVN